MNFYFDNDSPIYIQLVEQLKLYIVSGKIEPGGKLPSIRELSLQLQINPNTIQKALQELENLELIYTERTNGKYVTSSKKNIGKTKKEMTNEKIIEFITDMANLGISKEEIIKNLLELGEKE